MKGMEEGPTRKMMVEVKRERLRKMLTGGGMVRYGGLQSGEFLHVCLCSLFLI